MIAMPAILMRLTELIVFTALSRYTRAYGAFQKAFFCLIVPYNTLHLLCSIAFQ
jgi:hypothetical protein